MAHLKARALSVKQCRKMLADAKEGEEKLHETEADSDRLLEELGIKMIPSEFLADSPPSTPAKPQPAVKRRPGERKPQRDPVGLEHYAA